MSQRIDDPIAAAIGQRLQQARRRDRRKLSQEKLATIADVDRAMITRIEQGTRRPSVGVLCEIARALRIDPGRLLPSAGELVELDPEPEREIA